jgi:hypothetical protein
MHAKAYATGNHVAFAAAPDLRLAAHEAAHAVQQREGVQLSGGIGRAGDEYERHADAVADQVVRGESAAALLQPMTQQDAARGREVQRQDSDQASQAGEQRTDSAGARGDEGTTGLGSNVSSDPIINRIAEVHPDGITIVLYAEHPITGDEEVDKNNREFVVQGRGAGRRYQAVSASGDQLILGQGIPFRSRTDISQNVNHAYTTLRARYQATRAEGAEDEPRFLRANRLTIFCHGSEQRLRLPGADLTISNLDAFVDAIRDALHPGVNVQLFACNVANGDDSLAAVMAGALGEEASVFGHTTPAHTTENAQARVFGAAAGNQPEGKHMRDIMFPPAFIEAEMTRIWGTFAEGERERLRSMLGARVERFYQWAAGLRGGWDNEVRQSMQRETAGEGNIYSRRSMFGREMFMNPDRARDIAQRHFVQWVASHIREFEVLHPVTEAARNGAAASGSAPSPASAEPQASDTGAQPEQPATSTPAASDSAAPPGTGSPGESAVESGDEPADVSAARPLLRMGSRGDAVHDAQRLLNTHGAQIAENGEFESSTRAAVIAFQRLSSLAVDGIIGEHTWAALHGETPAAGTPAATDATRDEAAAVEQDAEDSSRSEPAELSEDESAIDSGSEWNRRSRPRAGQTLQGCPLQQSGRHYTVTANGRSFVVRQYRGSGPWGIMYSGNSGNALLRQVMQEMSAHYRETGETYRAQAVLGMRVLGEGGISAINTYDNQVFTLGAGFAGGRLNRLLHELSGTPAASAVSSISYFSGLRFNRSEEIRLDIRAISRLVAMIENSHAEDFARAQVREYLAGSALPTSNAGAAERTGNQIADQVQPAVIGVAAYLKHGRPRFTPNPPADVQTALRIAPGNPSAQMAVLLKLHAQRIARDRERSPRVYRNNAVEAAERRLPNKIPHFERAMKAEQSDFRFDYGAASGIIPCLGSGAWATRNEQPSGVWLHEGNRYWDFGSPI